MVVLWSLLISAICWSCSNAEKQNDPYTIEETEVEHTPPAPYYDEKDGNT